MASRQFLNAYHHDYPLHCDAVDTSDAVDSSGAAAPSDEASDTEFQAFVVSFDMNLEVIGVITPPGGEHRVVPLYSLSEGVNASNEIDRVEATIDRLHGRLRVAVQMESRGFQSSCTEPLSWESKSVVANYCIEDSAGQLSCSGPLSVERRDWEIRFSEEGEEDERRQVASFSRAIGWRGEEVQLERRSGSASAALDPLRGRHSVAELAARRRR